MTTVIAPRERASRWPLLAAGWIAALAALGLWIASTPEIVLRYQLTRWQFWSLEAQFLLFSGLAILTVPALLRSLDFEWRDFPLALFAAAAAFLLAGFVAPNTSRIYYDEQIYQSVGQNLADLKYAQMCNDGNVEYGVLQCWRGEYNKEPYAYPYLLSIAYRVFGVHEGLAHALNAISVALLVLVVALTAILLTGDPAAGGFAALVAALIPEHLRWSHTAAAEPTAALACATAVLAALAFVRLRSTTSLLWMVSATAAAVQFRPECILIVPVVLATVGLLARDEFTRPRLWWTGLLGLVLLSTQIAHLMAVRHEGWGSPGPRFALRYLALNLHTNGWFFLGDARFPLAYTLLAAAALAGTWRLRSLAVPVLQFLAFWGIFLIFYAGSYNYGADDRFSLMVSAPIAVLAGIGAWEGARLLRRFEPRRAVAIVATAIAIQFLWYMPYVRSIGEEAWGARADVRFARTFTRSLPPNAVVLTHNPNMFHVWGQSAAQAGIATVEPDYVQNVLAPRYAGGVFFHWNFWCNVADPVQQAFCSTMLERYPHTLVQEYRERDYRYALYRLEVAPVTADSLRATTRKPTTGATR